MNILNSPHSKNFTFHVKSKNITVYSPSFSISHYSFDIFQKWSPAGRKIFKDSYTWAFQQLFSFKHVISRSVRGKFYNNWAYDLWGVTFWTFSPFTFLLFNPSYYVTVSSRILLSLVHFQLVLRFEFTELLKQYLFFFLPAVKFIRIKLVWFL